MSSLLPIFENRFDLLSKPRVTIQLNGESQGLPQLTPFNTGEKVTGSVKIRAPHDTPIENVEIMFEGIHGLSSHTKVSYIGLHFPGRSQTAVEQSSVCTGWQHVFLKAVQSISSCDYPRDQILHKNHTYAFPFAFEIPTRVSRCVCDHPHDTHTLLPPTLGDREIPNGIATIPSWLTPSAGQITYRIKATITHKPYPNNAPNTLASASQSIWVIPISESEPKLPPYELSPLVGTGEVLSLEKLIVSHGTLRIEASPQKPIQLLGSDELTRDSWTFTRIKVVFEPHNASKHPPQIRSLRTRLAFLTSMKASTRYYNRQATLCPTKDQYRTYTRYLPMSHLEVSHRQWERSGTLVRSQTSLESLLPLHVEGPSGKLQHTMEFIIPINVPGREHMVANFDSCLISRSYLLDITLSYRPRGAVLNQRTMIQIPLQFNS